MVCNTRPATSPDKGAVQNSLTAVPQYTSCCCSIQLPGAQHWQWQTLTSPAVQCIPPWMFCSRQDSQLRVSGPLAFQQMQKMASSKASRQASAQRTPRRGALKEVLSDKHMNFTFYMTVWGPAIVFTTYQVSSYLPPAYLYTSLPSQDYRLPQSFTLQTSDHKSPTRPPRKKNQARTQILIRAHHSLSLLIIVQTGSCPNWFALVLVFASSCQCTSSSKLSLPSGLPLPSSLSNVLSNFGKTATSVFHLQLLICWQLSVHSLQTQEVFRLILFWKRILFVQ